VPEFPIESPVEISRRLEIRGKDSSSWIAILNSAIGTSVIPDALREDLAALLQTTTRTLSLHDGTFEQLRTEMHQPSDDVVFLTAVAELPPEKWSALDLMRSALERRGPIVLWLSAEAFAGLSEFAPNIRSFIGSSIFVAGPDGGVMTEEERKNRLNDLATHYGQSDADVLRKAALGELPPEPHFVEWLVLLGRGDLV
jgi:hypothetical protein